MFCLFEKKTKWVILATYNAGGNDYILFARRGLESGMVYFKTKKTTPEWSTSYNFETSLFDIKKTFNQILESEGNK